MIVDETGEPQGIAPRAAVIDVVAPVPQAISAIVKVIEPITRMIETITPTTTMIADRLGSTMISIAKAAQAFVRLANSPKLLEFGRCLYEAILQFLEAMPGGSRLVRVVRAIVDPVFYRSVRFLKWACRAVDSIAPPSRVTSPRHLVSRSSRSLRGPSAALAIPHQTPGAALA